MFKSFIQKKLESLVKLYFTNHPEVKLIVVTGSVGKTSAKLAIATILSEKFKVRVHEGNHNTFLSAPLAILGVEYPKNIRNIFEWLAVFRAAKKRIKSPSDVDFIIQELGSDRIGQVPHFGTYLKPDIAVVTAISAEHMEYFKTIDTVAKEELSVSDYSKLTFINREDIDGKYAEYITSPDIQTYGTTVSAEYNFLVEDYSAQDGYSGTMSLLELNESFKVNIKLIGEHTLRPIVVASAIGAKFGMTKDEIISGIKNVRAVPGRMNLLKGIKDSVIIDDTYNSSPLAAQSAIRELYKLDAASKVAVLGSMNELGVTSQVEHEELGKMCDPNQLVWVVTVGKDANNYLAPAAKTRGCQVRSFMSAIEAGGFVNSIIEPGMAILFKGSQGDIYLEEAVKVILHNSKDESQLVRQSEKWMKIKNKFFSKF
ncbi:MAG: Mur ligase family protein [Candidatus Saccharimonadales bacterium]